MGVIFKFIADDALRASGAGPCHLCERAGVPVYDYTGEIINPDLAADPALAREEPKISWLCADCINGGNVRRTDTWAVADTVRRFAADPVAVWHDFNTLPGIPLFLQGKFDWPLCCGAWVEFTGCPSDLPGLLAIQASHQYWEGGPSAMPRGFKAKGRPESFREVSLFRCGSCVQGYYTDQFT
ncbi:hypothetical protein [Stenotrophomonas sp.]|uniref:hypothetical protein n=1 Tax=Stenotrophomonas sp. TaxID=69392 RepID=UPI0028AF27B0|nr:hypothetical protein [Stenotrophomonas sp.]